MSLLLDIAPAELGLPPRFTHFRPTQAEAIDYVTQSDAPFIAANAPTGVGKSLIAVTAAKTLASRAVYLTSTKALQEQILTDFASVGAVDVRGKANYVCRGYTSKWGRPSTCDEGSQKGCKLQFSDCPYAAAVQAAEQSPLITTNYSYWLHARRTSQAALEPRVPEDVPPFPIDLLICDEAHNAGEEICRFLQVTLPFREWSGAFPYSLGESGLMTDSTGDQWSAWAGKRVGQARAELEDLKSQHGTLAEARRSDPETIYLEALIPKLKQIQSMNDNWVWEIQQSHHHTASKEELVATFDVIWPGKMAYTLWSNVPKVLLLSATLRPYTLHLLGLSKDNYEFREFQNGWPKNHGIVYYIPTVRMNYRSDDAAYAILAARMDEIISSRLDRKGIIHAVSYSRMRRLMALSKFSKVMYFNETSAESTVIARRFREAKPPAILISPSYSTGWDFAYSQCEYQIIPKVPFPYADSRVMRERNKEESYRIYCAILEVTQMIGRGRRAPDDRCETFILDNNFPLVLAKGKPYISKGFTVHRSNTVPIKPKKL